MQSFNLYIMPFILKIIILVLSNRLTFSLCSSLSISDSQVYTDSTPSTSIALHSFMTAGILATSLAAAVLSVSSASLAAVGTQASGGTVFPDPSMNLHASISMYLTAFVIVNFKSYGFYYLVV